LAYGACGRIDFLEGVIIFFRVLDNERYVQGGGITGIESGILYRLTQHPLQ